MCSKKIICFLLFAILANSLLAQDANTNLLDSFTAKFIATIRANANELAYIVADKSVYEAGEYIWFNAFLLNTASQRLSSKSKLVFVDIADKNDNVIKHLILDAAGKQLYSRIQLPDSLPTGYYWLRAYTRQMAVRDTNNIGIQTLYVLGKTNNNAADKPTINKAEDNSAPVINLYPEGGNMITGIDATVAVTASTNNGVPLSIDGVIKDNKDTTIIKFTTDANGLGKFVFEPSGFRSYRAVINQNGKELSYPLPPFDFYKGQLAVTKQSGFYQVRVLLGDSVYSKEALTYVAGISKDSLVFAAFGKGLYQVNVDENKLPQGITTFYLFDKSFNLLSERSVYVNNNGILVNITTDKNNYAKRDKVDLNVSVTDASQHPVPSLISIAVSDSVFADKESCNIGNMAAVSYVDNLFLATHNCFSDEEKDLLMLTKTNTYTTLTKTVPPTATILGDSLFYVSGKVLNSKNESDAKVVTLISNGGDNGLFYTDTTDDAGRFRFALENIPDSLQYALEVKDLNNRVLNDDVETDAMEYPQLKTPAALRQTFSTALRPAINRLERRYNLQLNEDATHHLPPVTVKDEKVDYDISKRVSPFSTILSGKDFDGKTSVDNLMLKVSGLHLTNGYLLVRGLNSIKGSPGPGDEPMVLMNGVPVYISANAGVGNISPVLSYLSTLNPKDIDFIEVLKDGSASNYGVRGAYGVILINTTNRSHDLNTQSSNMKTFYATGIAKPALFPTIIYNEKNKKAMLQPDVHSTLFWNGHYITSNSGNATFTFFTNDVPGMYTATVTGITQHGDIIYKTVNLKVNE